MALGIANGALSSCGGKQEDPPQPPGTLDERFGDLGWATADFGALDRAYSVAIQEDGRVVAAGASASSFDLLDVNRVADFALARFLPDGRLDPQFGDGGRTTTDVGTIDRGNAIAIQADGRVLVAGAATLGTNTNIVLLRYGADGVLDSTFGSAGRVTWDFGSDIDGNFHDEAFDVVVQPDGKIVVAAIAHIGTAIDMVLLRQEPDGTADVGFGSSGVARAGVDAATRCFVRVGQDSTLTVGGTLRIGFELGAAVARFLPSGLLDGSFGGGAAVLTPKQPLLSVALDPDGSLVGAGWAKNPLDPFSFDFALLRYLPDGSLDPAFGTAGIVLTDLFGEQEYARGVTVLEDHRILVTGIITQRDFALLRYEAAGGLDIEFGEGAGAVLSDHQGGFDDPYDLALDAGGRIYLAGSTGPLEALDFAVTRYAP